jgi:RNA polymerase sigma-70 factor (ECF subfamily)
MGVMPLLRLAPSVDAPAGALSERTDDELMALCRAGLRPAFATLVGRHAQRLVYACTRLVGDVQLGRELAQDSWVLVWQGRDKYRSDGRFISWLVTVARNHCRNELRRRNVAAARSEELVASTHQASSAQLDALLDEERRGRVRRALDQLSEPHKEALLLRFAEGLRYDEIALVTATSESTLRSRVHHGLRALKQELEKTQ